MTNDPETEEAVFTFGWVPFDGDQAMIRKIARKFMLDFKDHDPYVQGTLKMRTEDE